MSHASSPPPQGIEQGHHLAGEHRPQKHPGQKDEQGVPRSQSEDGVHRDDVGQTQLHPLDGHQRGQLGLRHEDGQGDGSEQGQPGQAGGAALLFVIPLRRQGRPLPPVSEG